MRENEKGYIVVETVGTFLPFTLLVISILSLVNIVAMQARIHNALTQTANTISMYGYVLKLTGVADELMKLDAKASDGAELIEDVLGGINAFPGSKGYDKAAAGRAQSAVSQAVGDPKHMIESLVSYGASELKNAALSQLLKPMVLRYLAMENKTGEEYLESIRVVSFTLDDSIVLDKDGNVKLTAKYEVEYTFGTLKLPFTPTLKITQTAKTKAWIGGSAGGYTG